MENAQGRDRRVSSDSGPRRGDPCVAAPEDSDRSDNLHSRAMSTTYIARANDLEAAEDTGPSAWERNVARKQRRDQASVLALSAYSRLAILPIPIPLPRITAVRQQCTLNYFGPVKSSVIPNAARVVATHTDTSEDSVMQTLQSFVDMSQENCLGSAEQKACFWLTIRITQPTDEFKMPRWHQDGMMFECDTDMEGVPRSKYALTLLGPPTLLLHQNQYVFETVKRGRKHFFWWHGTEKHVNEDQVDEADEGLRVWLAEQYEKEEKVKVRCGEIVRFSWGRAESPVHSEPDLDVKGGRVFMTVLFGSQAELERMSVFRDAKWGTVDV